MAILTLPIGTYTLNDDMLRPSEEALLKTHTYSSANGTQNYFYNDLTDLQKVIYATYSLLSIMYTYSSAILQVKNGSTNYIYAYETTNVYDGDSIVTTLDKGWYNASFVSIDAPSITTTREIESSDTSVYLINESFVTMYSFYVLQYAIEGMPPVYAFCPAGCKWETVHKEDTDAMALRIELLNSECNRLIQRVDDLGFREGLASYDGFNFAPIDNSLKKQGNYCIFNFEVVGASTVIPTNGTIRITIPEAFRPFEQTNIIAVVGTALGVYALTLTISTSGLITYTSTFTAQYPLLSFTILNSGWAISSNEPLPLWDDNMEV